MHVCTQYFWGAWWKSFVQLAKLLAQLPYVWKELMCTFEGASFTLLLSACTVMLYWTSPVCICRSIGTCVKQRLREGYFLKKAVWVHLLFSPCLLLYRPVSGYVSCLKWKIKRAAAHCVIYILQYVKLFHCHGSVWLGNFVCGECSTLQLTLCCGAL